MSGTGGEDDAGGSGRKSARSALFRETEPRSRSLDDRAESIGHVLFLPGEDGYELRDRSGPCPGVGDVVGVEDRPYRVLKIGISPLPGDERPCAYLEPNESTRLIESGRALSSSMFA